MKNFEYAVSSIGGEGQISATLVSLKGSIDPSSFAQFASMFDDLEQEEPQFIALDFHEIKYINSTGMGLMVQLSDSFKSKGGDIILLRIPPKVTLVMEMLGLQEFFSIVADESQVLSLLAGEEIEDAGVQMHLKDGKSDPTEKSARTTGGLECGNCKTQLTIPGPGKYCCPCCRALLEVDTDKIIKTHAPADTGVLEITLPANKDYLNEIAGLLQLAAKNSGLKQKASAALQAGVDSAGNYLRKNGFGKNSQDRLHLLLSTFENRTTLRLFATGTKLKIKSKNLAEIEDFKSAAGALNRFEYSAFGSGNLFLLEKKSN